MHAVLVSGPLHAGDAQAPPGVTLLRELEPAAMVDLIAGAEVVASSGGGLLGWVLSLGRPCVATPMPTEDQRQRTDACRKDGTAWVVDGRADALADGVLALARDARRRTELTQRLAERGPRNALPRCVELLEQLARERGAIA
jgi:UDP-N-acetylglucosamine:LPS N-acetylglucosamine transferase